MRRSPGRGPNAGEWGGGGHGEGTSTTLHLRKQAAENTGLGTVLAGTLLSCVTSDKLLHLSVFQFLFWEMRVIIVAASQDCQENEMRSFI